MTAKPELTLIHASGTRSNRIVFLLEELKLPYKVVKLNFNPYDEDSDFNTPEILEANPLRAVPALKDGDEWVVESGAILEYILARYGNGQLTPPFGSKEYGTYLRWLWFAEATLAVWAIEYEHHFALRPEKLKVAEVLPLLKPRIESALDVLEKALEGRPYILGDVFSAADINLSLSIAASQFIELCPEDKYGNIARYQKALLERPAAKVAFS